MSVVDAIKQALPKNSFVRSVLVLGGGTAGAQAISILSAPFLTRLYSAEAFGVVAVFISILGLFSVTSSLRYELAIPIAEDEEEAVHVVVLAFLIALLLSFLTLGLVAVARHPIADAVNIPALANYLWLLPLSLLLISAYQIFYYWAIRFQAFRAITRTRLTQSVSSLAVKLGGTAFGPLTLILGEVVSQAAGMTSLGGLVINGRWSTFKTVLAKDLLHVARRYQKFPLFTTWGSLLNKTGAQLPPLLFAAFFSPAAAGLFALANRMLSLPIALVAQAIANVFLSKAPDAHRENKLDLLVAKVHENLAKIAMPPTLLLALVGPDLFALAFGPEWREAGVFVRFMTPMLYFQFIVSPISTVFNVLDKQEQGLILQGQLVLIRGTSLLVGAWLNNLRMAILLFGLGSAFSYFIFLIRAMKISGNPVSRVVKTSFGVFCNGVLLTSPLLIVKLPIRNIFFEIGAIALTVFLIFNYYSSLIKKVADQY
jgi:O-antigen/teichoic acid export membrane protein